MLGWGVQNKGGALWWCHPREKNLETVQGGVVPHKWETHKKAKAQVTCRLVPGVQEGKAAVGAGPAASRAPSH